MNLYYYVVTGGELYARLTNLQILKAEEKRSRLDVLAKYNAEDIGADSDQKSYLAYTHLVDNPMFKQKRFVVESGYDNLYAHYPDTRSKAGRQLLRDIENSTYITKTDLVHNTVFGNPDGALRFSCQPILVVKPEYDLLVMAVWSTEEPAVMLNSCFVKINPKSLIWLDDAPTDSVQSAVERLQSYSEEAVFQSNILTYKSRTERLLTKLDYTTDSLERWRIEQRISDMCEILDSMGYDSSEYKVRA